MKEPRVEITKKGIFYLKFRQLFKGTKDTMVDKMWQWIENNFEPKGKEMNKRIDEGFSWEQPIEEDILAFTRHMAETMERVASNRETGWFANNRLQDDAQKMADAYRTVEAHIMREIKIRRKIKK